MKKQLEINIKDNLQEYLPSIFLLLNNENIKWDKIAMKYQDELYSRLSKSKIAKEGNDITSYEVCLFDVITRVVMGDFSFYNLLKFVDDIFRNLAKKTTEAEKKFLKDTMYNVLINTDKNYLNFIGEFAALNNMKNEEWELLSTEQPLTDNKKSIKADFEIRKNSITLLVEIVKM